MEATLVCVMIVSLVSDSLATETIQGEEDRRPLVSLTVYTDQVFSFFLAPHYFNWTQEQWSSGGKDQVSYRASTLGQPALPPWVRHRTLPGHKGDLLYGLPPTPGLTSLQVVITNRHTFHTGLLIMHLQVEEKKVDLRQVNLMIDNLNIEDVFDEARIHRMEALFRQKLWLESHQDLHLTFAESALHMGGRRPLQPALKDGVVVRFGSQANFSTALKALDRETQPLRKLTSCSYKRVSVERYFRQAGFAVDWCAFRLMERPKIKKRKEEENEEEEEKEEEEEEEEEERREHRFPVRGTVDRSLRMEEMLTAAFIPILIFVIFCGGIGGILWADCGEEKQKGGVFVASLFSVLDDCCVSPPSPSQLISANNNNVSVESPPSRALTPSPPSPPSPSRASSVQRQTDTLRSLARRRDVTPRLQASPPPGMQSVEGSSIHSRSRTGSPVPVLVPSSPLLGPRQSLDWEMFESLNRPNPPAYGTLPRNGETS